MAGANTKHFGADEGLQFDINPRQHRNLLTLIPEQR
jgi:hypothetical protein